MTKKPSRSVISLALLSVVMLAYSCTFGLESLGSAHDDATVAISIPAPVSGQPGSEGRAIAPTATNLYIRTLGGPDGTGAKSYFGPYATVPGSTFKTKDIEPGSYDGFVLLVTSSPIDNLACSVNGVATTFGAVFSLPDAAFLSAIAADSLSGLTIFDSALGNTASFAVLGPTTIKEGKGNSLTATLMPATAATVAASEGGTLSSGDSGTYRSFVRVTALKTRADSSFAVKGRITNSRDTGANLAAFAAYRMDGSPIPDSAISSTAIAVGKSVEFTISTGGDDSCFIYIEFIAPTLTLEFAKPAVPAIDPPSGPTVQVAFAGKESQGTKRAFFAVYDASGAVYNEDDEDYDIVGKPVALGMATLDGSGNGTSYACAPNTADPKTFAPGTYFVSGFVDMEGTYDDVLGPEGIAAVGTIMPHSGDAIPLKKAYACVVGSTPATHTFDSAAFVKCNDNVVFVSQNGGGTGNRQDSAVTIEIAQNWLVDAMPDEKYLVFLTEPISTETGLNVNDSVTLWIMSADDAPKTISYADEGDSPLISVGAGGFLFLDNCVLDGMTLTRSTALVKAYGTVTMTSGSGIQNTKNSSSGGGVYLDSFGTLIMRDGTIRNCDASDGGAIYMQPADGIASFFMMGGHIEQCTATSSGGGVFAYTETINKPSIHIDGGTIRNCGAPSGAGVYLGNKAEMTLASGTISDSVLPTNGKGGGVHVGDSATFTIEGGSITGTTAGTPSYGGGAYIAYNGNIVLTDGQITGCSATTGGGIYVDAGGKMNGLTYDQYDDKELLDLILREIADGNIGSDSYLKDAHP